MKLHSFFQILCLLMFVVVMDQKTTHANDDMKNNNRLFSAQILKISKTNPTQNPQWIRGTKIRGWRFLDKNNQSLGTVKDIDFDAKSGEMRTITISLDGLVFEEQWQFDVVAHNLSIEDHVIRTDLDKKTIGDHPRNFTNNRSTEENTRNFSLSELLKASVVNDNNQIIGRIVETYSPAKKNRIDYATIYITDLKKFVTIPVALTTIIQNTDQKIEIHVTKGQAKIMQQYAR